MCKVNGSHRTCISLNSNVRWEKTYGLQQLTSQFPPPKAPETPEVLSPKVNMLSSPFWMTTKTSNHDLSRALLPADSQYCLRQSMPSFAQGAPSKANSSSEMLIVVEVESSLRTLRSSSSCASRIIVCDRFEAKPRVGLRKVELEPYIAW